MRVRSICLALALMLSLFWTSTTSAQDFEAVGGHFFGQTAEGEGTGFGISDADDIRFWSTFRELGGAQVLGYPVSRRFTWQDRATQVFQRAVLQHDPSSGRVVALNVLDLLHERGVDPWLETAHAVPRHGVPIDEAGRSWEEVVLGRQRLLDGQPALRNAYFGVSSPMAVYGLPTSPIVDMGSHYAIRLQRGVLQLWKQDVPWASAGQVTAALAGDVARDAGLFGAEIGEEAFTPEPAWEPRPTPAPRAAVPPVVQRPSTVPPGIRWIDVNLSRQLLTAMEDARPVRYIPISSGRPAFPTPTGTFRIFNRVFNETMDSSTIGIPRSSPGGYLLRNVYFTQYFAPGGYALHANYWQPASVFGNVATSHGCVGMLYADAEFLWRFATIGTPVHIHR